MSSEIVIKIDNLSKCYHVYDKPNDRLKQMLFGRYKQFYKEHWAVKGVSLEIKKGETVGIIGKNGSGKSTLLQLLCGTLNPTEGEYTVNGRVAALLELGSGFSPEFTGRENIFMNGAILGLSNEEIHEKYDDIVEFSGINEFIEQPVKTYSSGMVVRLAFAVIAHVNADILVVDEALSVGDAFFVQKCMRFLRSFMETGTVIFVSHDIGTVLNLCQKAILMQDGVICAQGKPKAITELYLEKIYEIDSIEPDAELEKTFVNNTESTTRDMRLDFINKTTLRNDIELFPFTPNTPSFGEGGAKIVGVELQDEFTNKLSWVVGGERVSLVIDCSAKSLLLNPIIGFQVKDRLGQVIFGDNTYLTYQNKSKNMLYNQVFKAKFEFIMPILPLGDYTIGCAVADGTQQEHIPHHWVHEAMTFKVHHTSTTHGLIGVPMLNIEFVV